MTATQTPCTPEADRFQRGVEVPDPPPSPQGRKCYWDDTVQEAVGELRRRLASTREAVVTMALATIMAVETTRIRHGRPISGTQVSNVNEADDWDPLPKLAPLPSMCAAPRKSEPEASATEAVKPVADASGSDQTAAEPTTPVVAGREAGTTSPTTDAHPATVSPTRERGPLADDNPEASGPRSRVGLTAAPAPTPAPIYTEPKRMFSDRDDDWTRDPARSALPDDWEPGPTRAEADAAYDAVVERQREGFIESCGCYPEDEYPNNPDYFRFKAEPRPHPAFLRYLCWKYGTGDDTLPLGVGCPPPDGAVPAVPLSDLRATVRTDGQPSPPDSG